MTAVLLALVASVLYGSSQFLAGRASVRTAPAVVSLVELGVTGYRARRSPA